MGKKLHPVLATQVKHLIEKVKENHLWEKLIKIVRELGIKTPGRGGTFSQASWELNLFIDGTILKIRQSAYAMGGDYLMVDYDGERVFEADEVNQPLDNICQEQRYLIIDPNSREVRPEDGKWIYVRKYLSGVWEDKLNFEKIKALIEEQKQRELESARQKKEAEERARPYTDKERELARAFGLRTK